MQDIFDAAFTIALINLRNRYTLEGTHAGRHHFSDVWTRDCCFASFGSLSIGDTDIVRTGIITLLKLTNEEGQVPLRVGQKYFLLKYLFNLKGRSEPRYLEDKRVSYPVDNNPLLFIMIEHYLQKTQNIAFLKPYFPTLSKMLKWEFSQDRDQDLLIEEDYYGGWADSLKKKGKVLYSNVLHWHAVNSFSRICGYLGYTDLSHSFEEISSAIKSQIHTYFWNGRYFIDWINTHRHDYFSTDGNLLAILFGLTQKEQAISILECIKNFNLDKGASVATNYPKYSCHDIYHPFLFINMGDYHNGMSWLWLGALYAVTLYRTGLKEESHKALYKLAKKILEFKGVFETYSKGKPVKRLFYNSEDGFAWSAGLFVWACKEVGIK